MVPTEVMPDDTWKLDAKCKTLSPKESDDLFFVERGGTSVPAKNFCLGGKLGKCPVVFDCAKHALETNSVGFWGGMTEDERELFSGWFNPDKEALDEGLFDPPLLSLVESPTEPIPTIGVRSENNEYDLLLGISEPLVEEVMALEAEGYSLLHEDTA